MTKAEEIVTKLSRDFNKLDQLVQGNGTVTGSVVGRVAVLEQHCITADERLAAVENYPCKNGCLFEANEKEEETMKSRNRGWRIGDIGNAIQLVVMFIMLYQILKLGGV